MSLTLFDQSTEARRAVPCWDEPMIKAKWDVTMVSRADTVNLSNMPIKTEEPYDPVNHTEIQEMIASLTATSDKWKVTKFETTPLMSSYLLAYANGPFEFLETSAKMPLSGRTIPLRIYGQYCCRTHFIPETDWLGLQVHLIAFIRVNLHWM
jgi:aminopeptidase 2